MSVFTGVVRLLAGATILIGSLSLSACGGGGAAAGTPVLGGGATPAPGGGSVADTAVLTMALSSTTVTAGAPATVTVTVKNKSGASVPGQVVKFSTDANLGSFSAPSALTDGNGVATVILSPAAATATGADVVKATVNYSGKDYIASTGFQTSATKVTIASFTADVANLSAYGQANLTVTLADTTSNSPVSLTVTSSCTAAGKGTLTPASQTTSTGRATFTFRDGGCATTENLQVSVAGTALTKSLSLPVASPNVASIGFVSASPGNIYLRGSGLVENSNVTFQVKDAANNGVAGQLVTLEPSVWVGGLTINDVGVPVTALTDTEGKVTVRINSGTVPTPVRVKATLDGSNISTVSSSLSIAVGLPSQLNFSLAQGARNIEGYSVQGTPNTYTVIASDRLGNPVPEGTAINFVTEGGQIQASKQTILDSRGLATATANFATASPVPVDGRITVVAYALGEKSFLDTDGNNVFTQGEQFQDLGDIFLDRKYDNYYDAAEDQFVSVSKGDNKACIAAASDLLATDVSIPSRPNTCSQAWGQAYVRRAVQTIFSTSSPRPLWGTSWNPNAVGVNGTCANPISLLTHYDTGNKVELSFRYFGAASLYAVPAGGTLSLIAADANPIAFNPMAAGTVVSVAASDGLTVNVLGGSPVADSGTPTGVAISYKFDDKTSDGTIAVTFKSPSGLATAVSQFISMRTIGANVVAGSPDEAYRRTLAPCNN